MIWPAQTVYILTTILALQISFEQILELNLNQFSIPYQFIYYFDNTVIGITGSVYCISIHLK